MLCHVWRGAAQKRRWEAGPLAIKSVPAAAHACTYYLKSCSLSYFSFYDFLFCCINFLDSFFIITIYLISLFSIEIGNFLWDKYIELIQIVQTRE